MRFEVARFDRLVPDAAFELANEFERRAGAHDASGRDDRHPLAQIRHVVDDVRGEDDDDVLADLGEQVQEAVALFRIQTGGRLIDDDQRGVADQRLRDAEPLAHAAREPRQRVVPDVPQVDLVQQRLDRLPPLAALAMPLSTAMWSSISYADTRG